MADMKQYKESESKVHEQLYGNLFLLSHCYPTSRDFNAIFKKDMFVKNNKAAFFQVVYYLLNILNPVLTKEKLPSWPPYEIKRENKFRGEVLRYINDLNVLYDNADIPHIMSSHLISPGGFKFAKFMLKLSQLVVYEHLKKTEELSILYCLKPSKNVNITKSNISNLNRRTGVIEMEIREIVNEFESYHFELNEKAILIDSKLTELNQQLRASKQRYMEVKDGFNKKYPAYPSLNSLEENINLLKDRWGNLQEIQKLFKECESLLLYLNNNELVLDHCKEEMKLPTELLCILKNQDKLNLIELFESLNSLLERNALEWPNLTDHFLNNNIEKLKELNEQMSVTNNVLSEEMKIVQNRMEKLTRTLKQLADLHIESDPTDEVLAVPLDDSEKSQ